MLIGIFYQRKRKREKEQVDVLGAGEATDEEEQIEIISCLKT